MYYINRFFTVTEAGMMTVREQELLKEAGNFFESRDKAEEVAKRMREMVERR